MWGGDRTGNPDTRLKVAITLPVACYQSMLPVSEVVTFCHGGRRCLSSIKEGVILVQCKMISNSAKKSCYLVKLSYKCSDSFEAEKGRLLQESFLLGTQNLIEFNF